MIRISAARRDEIVRTLSSIAPSKANTTQERNRQRKIKIIINYLSKRRNG